MESVEKSLKKDKRFKNDIMGLNTCIWSKIETDEEIISNLKSMHMSPRLVYYS